MVFLIRQEQEERLYLLGIFFEKILRERDIKARFIRAGSNQYPVRMLEEGVVDYILDGQTFDLEGVRSMRENNTILIPALLLAIIIMEREFCING